MTGGPLFFLHIPRTGGTSLIEYLDRKMMSADICPAHEMFEFEQLHQEGRLNSFGFYRGHFGINMLDQIAPFDGHLITLMRSPLPRIFSTWRHAGRARPPFPRDLSPLTVRAHRNFEAARNLSFRQYCEWIMEQGFQSIFNQMTVWLGLGRGFGVAEDPDLDRSVLERAKRAVERFSFIGFSESLDLSVKALQSQFGWDGESIAHANAGPISPFPEDDELIKWLSHAAKFDIELYNYAASRFACARTDDALGLKTAIDTAMERAAAADTAPRLLYTYKGYNVVSVKGLYVAAARELGPMDACAVLGNSVPRPPAENFMIAHTTSSLEAKIDAAHIEFTLAAVKNSLDEKNDRISALEAAMEERSRRLTAVEATLAERTQRLTALEASITERTKRLAALEISMEERTQRLASLEARLEERTRDPQVSIPRQRPALK